jgi:hypothetical protein
MGMYNSSETRVRLVFEALFRKDSTGTSWLWRFWVLATTTRTGDEVAPAPTEVGELVADEVLSPNRDGRPRAFERVVPPSTAFLRWLLENPTRLAAPDDHYGSRDEDVRRKRQELLTGNRPVQAEGLAELERNGGTGSRGKWWAFEGFTHLDCCLVTAAVAVAIEGKRTETVSPATRWFAQRNQLWRNVEVVRDLAGQREFGVILAVERHEDGRAALEAAGNTLAGSCTHLDHDQQQALARHLLGYVVWADVVREFDLPSNCLRERTV